MWVRSRGLDGWRQAAMMLGKDGVGVSLSTRPTWLWRILVDSEISVGDGIKEKSQIILSRVFSPLRSPHHPPRRQRENPGVDCMLLFVGVTMPKASVMTDPSVPYHHLGTVVIPWSSLSQRGGTWRYGCFILPASGCMLSWVVRCWALTPGTCMTLFSSRKAPQPNPGLRAFKILHLRDRKFNGSKVIAINPST